MKRVEVEVLPWVMEPGDDGLVARCLLLGKLEADELVSVRLLRLDGPVPQA